MYSDDHFVWRYIHGQETLDAYITRLLGKKHLQVLNQGGSGLMVKCARIIELALRELDKLPRTDPFWRNTNKLTTQYKRSAYSERRLSENPRDPLANWLRIAWALWSGSDQLKIEYWLPIKEIGELNVAWVIQSAKVQTDPWCDKNSERLARLLLMLDVRGEAQQVMEELQTTGSAQFKNWVKEVREAVERMHQEPDCDPQSLMLR